jgi:hypothetical protein
VRGRHDALSAAVLEYLIRRIGMQEHLLRQSVACVWPARCKEACVHSYAAVCIP